MRTLWVSGGVVIATIGKATLDNDEVQAILKQLALLWSQLGLALGLVAEEDVAELDAIVRRG
jgi:hypothetical protein